MSVQELFPAPYSERGNGFAVQAVTHWLRVAPGRVMFGLKAGGLPVGLPDRPAAVSHRGVEAKADGHITAIEDVSSAWLREHPDVTSRYVTALREVLTNPRVRLDGYATHAIFTGSVELYAGSRMDSIAFELDDEDGSYERVIELLRHAPRDGRTAFAMPPEPGMGSFEDPVFLAGDQAWIDGQRVLIEYVPDEGGRAETVALDRDSLADAVERAWVAMMDVSERIRDGLAKPA
ncbi:hypothetical protein C8J98_11288 [Luteibacter sp. OK325]|uniref:hypothetical protein n=1 Tax=Luteibacter sp. OK325 TaxID=2135670 RepID=UPI000D3BD848|nr:hypothetical protein [Luteibacter sp. OK325]PTR24705.1 hypothetical protein C8J98_11288 [Luteibacter sp. OK325]